MRLPKHRQRMLLFLAVFLVAYLISEAGMLLVYRRNEAAYVAEYESSCRKNVENLTEHFGAALQACARTASTLFSQRWYKHLRNYVGYYEEEFDSATKEEILEIIEHTVSSMQYADDVLLIVPETNAVLCKNGWLKPEEYAKIYGHINVSIDENKAVSVSGDVPYICINDVNARKYTGYAVIVLNADRLKKQFQGIMDTNAVYVKAYIGDTLLFEIGTADENQYVYSSAYIYPTFRVTLGYLPADTADARLSFLLLSVVLLLLFILIGMLEYRRVMRPMHRLVMASGGQKSDLREPYDYVYGYIERLKNMQAQLASDNQDKMQAMQRISEQAREAVLYAMLTQKVCALNPQNALLVFPWMCDVRDMCLLGLSTNAEEAIPLRQIKILDAMNHVVQTPTNTGCFAVVWLSNDLTAEEKEEYAQLARREWGRQNNALCFLSTIFDDFSQLGSMGQMLAADMAEGMRISSALPERVRMEIAELLRARDRDALAQCYQGLHSNYEASDVLNWLNALSDRDGMAQSADWDGVWQRTEALLSEESQTSMAATDDGAKYVAYIDEHLCDGELGIALVSEAFGKHRTIISKEIKAYTGMTFTDYLRARRIGIAQERIRNSDDNIMRIATEVGYVSYSTFKRAFMQVTGKTPMEYRGGTEPEE